MSNYVFWDPESEISRARLGWWAFVLVLAAAVAYIAYSFVGMIVLGVFGYYATRPIYRHIDNNVESDAIAAWATVLLLVLPILLLAVYAGFQAGQRLQAILGGEGRSTAFVKTLNLGALPSDQRGALMSALKNPQQLVSDPQQAFDLAVTVVSALGGGLVLVALAVTLSYVLLRSQEQFSDALVDLFGGRDSVAYAYAVAVDEDLESVFFGNLLFILVMAVIATATYWGTNVVAPSGLHVPMVLTLGFLTGVASIVPIVVGKAIYLPVVGYLAYQALSKGGTALTFVAGVLVVYFLVLDILPQTFIQPYITGRDLDMVMLLFAYLLGPILFGWYGFFLLPIVFIMALQAARIVLPDLVHGEPLTPDVAFGGETGTNPSAASEAIDEDGTDDAAAGGE